ncbi:39S ribosomal protein L16, mitochondrial [Rhipicephalus sanguineus]|nr:39S ribosomal protein L16, mitochondrial [Rhipicephalus sanguineus]
MAAPRSAMLAVASKTAQLLSCKSRVPQVVSCAGLKLWKVPPTFEGVEFPEERKLRVLEKVPTYPFGVRPPKMFKDLATIRGPELVHNRLLYNQYGIMALSGAFLRPGHIDMIRLNINKKLDVTRMFAVWRIDPPWKPITKKGQGKRMGKGKGSIDHYVTPIKAGRVIIEIGGHVEFEEIKPLLEQVCHKLPVDAIPITNQVLEEIRLEEEELERKNINPFSIERVIDYKMHDSARWISKYDRKYYTKYV